MIAHVDGPPLSHLEEMIWIGSIPRIGATRYPDRDAIICPDKDMRITYLDLDRQSDAFAALLAERGFGFGDRVAYLGKNSDLFFAVMFGAIRAGAVVVPINWRLAPHEVAFQLNDSGAKLLLYDPDIEASALSAVELLAHRPETVATEGSNSTPILRSLLQRAAPPALLPSVKDQVVLHLYTSGTTGHPKGVLISHHALSIARHSELTSPDFAILVPGGVSLSAMPNFHVGGMSWVLIGLVRFGTVVLTAKTSPTHLLDLLTEYKVESCFFVPTVIRAIVDEINIKQPVAPAMSGLFYGAMTIGAGLLRETMNLLGCAFGQFFGMTEIAGAATFLSPNDHDLERPHLLASVGRAYPGMSIEIRGPDRRVLNVGDHGEIWIQSRTCMTGYWRLPEATQQAIVDGWYATGDGGYLDAEGYLYLTDRIKDMIISGGENIYPAEIEETLRAHPAVRDAACVGVTDATWGESVIALVELHPAHFATSDNLKLFARTRLAGYKCPKHLYIVESLPRTASGKVKRAELRLHLPRSTTQG